MDGTRPVKQLNNVLCPAPAVPWEMLSVEQAWSSPTSFRRWQAWIPSRYIATRLLPIFLAWGGFEGWWLFYAFSLPCLAAASSCKKGLWELLRWEAPLSCGSLGDLCVEGLHMHLSAAPAGLEAFMMWGKFQPKLSAVLYFTTCSSPLTGVFSGLIGIKDIVFHFSKWTDASMVFTPQWALCCFIHPITVLSIYKVCVCGWNSIRELREKNKVIEWVKQAKK